MHVVEVTDDDPYAAQSVLHALPEVASVTQLGVRLRVLIPDQHDAPLDIVRNALTRAGIGAHAAIVPATLEDVFVAVTMDCEERHS